MKILIASIFFLSAEVGNSQNSYSDSLIAYQKDYTEKHEVVMGEDKQFFRFYPTDEKYRVTADFKRAANSNWFSMETSGAIKKVFRVYGVVQFIINDTTAKLNIYQSQALMNADNYEDHLFLPFADMTSGEGTYEAGRYLDIKISDIRNDKVVIDFNKSYNPYCAYVDGKYNCPIPPRENQLDVWILAGEMIFAKPKQSE